MRTSTYLSLAASAATALAATKGFNYGSTFTSGAVKVQSDFEDEFNTAKALVGTSGFTSARLYTGIQGGTDDTVISAIPAAISTETTLLLGLWASAGQANFNFELTALTNAISQYGDAGLADLVVGISVGSEDLYRITPTGIAAKSGAGADPSTLVDYITQVRNAIKGTVLANVPVGHVDTWTAWVNGSNDAVISASDFIGMDAYPYFQNTMSNGIEDGASLFSSAYQQTLAAAGSVPVWITETGWPVSGDTENLGVPSLANAKTYWDDVGCDLLFDKVNTWWYTLQDAQDGTPDPSFGIVGSTLSDTPLFDLTCPGASSSSSASSSAATTSKSVAAASTASNDAKPTSTISENPVPSANYAASTTVSAMTTGSTTSVAEGGKTLTVYQTTLITITSCSTVCVSSTMSTAASATAAASSASVTAETTSASATSASASASASSCPADISGDYQYPHLIVPVNSASPDTAYGTQYFGNISSTVSTIFNFDIPASYSGKTCSLVFLFPEKADLETSDYTFNNEGGLVSHVLKTTATSSTTYANAPAFALENGSIPSLVSGNSYVISSDSCPGGETVSFELSASGGADLYFFEDYNPSPLGLYVRAC